jgi:hypothetical protein
MPLTKKGRRIMREMKQEYGPSKGEEVFYAAANKGTIKGVHQKGNGNGDQQGKSPGKHRSKSSRKGA